MLYTKQHIQAKKRFGQNFLQSPSMIDKIITAIHPKKTDFIVEIGPGHAAITKPLVAKSGRVEAIEIDRDLAEKLRKESMGPSFVLHEADALSFDFNQFHESFRLVGNLPYNIASPLLFYLLGFAHNIRDIHVMLQREVADRIVAQANEKDYGRLSVMLQYYCECERLFLVPAGVFYPPPQVMSAFLRLIPKKTRQLAPEDEPYLETVVKLAFAQRRKTLKNNFKSIVSQKQWQDIALDPGQRAENLNLEDFILLTKKIGRLCHTMP